MNNNEKIYEQVTERILNQMEKGIIPWHQPWSGGMMAISHTTGKPYSMLNQMLLGMRAGEFLTFNQCKKEGGSVKKGEKGSMIVFWQTSYYRNEEIEDENGEKKTVKVYVEHRPVLKSFTVFHVDQCEGIKSRFAEDVKENGLNPIEEAENVVGLYFSREACKLHVENSFNAYYSPSEDAVHVPMLEQYKVAEEYYSTLFHEMTHSTGHKTRLDRLTKDAAFGSEDYSREELVAEMGAAFMMGRIGLDCETAFDNSVAYLQGWLKALRDDKHMMVVAAGKAEAAVRYIFEGKKENQNNNN